MPMFGAKADGRLDAPVTSIQLRKILKTLARRVDGVWNLLQQSCRVAFTLGHKASSITPQSTLSDGK